MTPRKFTFSTLDRHMACATSAVLDVWPDVGGESDSRGTAVHAHLEAIPVVGASVALAQAPAEHRDLCARIALDDLPLDPAHHREVALALNLATGEARRLEVSGRDYPDLGPEWVMGRLDVAGVDGETALVADYKTGRSARARYQVIAGMLAWSAVTGMQDARGEVIHIDDDGEVRRQPAIHLDAFEMVVEMGTLRDAVASWHRMRAEGVVPPPVPGPHCKYCPCWRGCPEKTGLVRQAAGENGVATLEQLARAAAMVDDVPRALRLADALKEAAGRIYQQAHAIAAEVGPIQIDDKMALGLTSVTSPDEMRGEVVRQVVAQELGAEVADVAVEMSATKASLKRALDKARDAGTIPKGQGAATERRILAMVVEAGGVIHHAPKARVAMFRRDRPTQ